MAGTPASAAGESLATYIVQNAPATMGVGTVVTVQATLTNTGTAIWNATGQSPVNVTYHWYDATGKTVVWDGDRTPLGADVGPTTSKSVGVQVSAPTALGVYQLRLTLVREGVAWFAPETAGHTVTVVPAFAATFGSVTLPSFVAGGTYSVGVPLTNSGTVPWNAAAPNPVLLSYHWLDPSGTPTVWDGARTPLGSDLLANSSRTLQATVTAPDVPGTYVLALDLVREGIGWLGQAARFTATVDAATYRALYSVAASSSALIGESKTLTVAVTNTGNVPWSSGTTPNPVNLGYHWFDITNTRIVQWDSVRAALPAVVAPSATVTMQLAVVMPATPGSYTLQVELVKEGVAWFSGLGTPAASLGFQVTSGFGAGYGADNMPASITNGATFPVTMTLTNTGVRAWPASGSQPVRLSYHIYDSSGRLTWWAASRGYLPTDVPAGASVTVNIVPQAPGGNGTYSLRWDMVQEGVGWFSLLGVDTKSSMLSVFPGVTFYGKGWGHGVGMSQWGAQGWAMGVAGPPLTGEQIVTKYFPGASITPITTGTPFRVLLSAPSTGCVGRTIYGAAHLRSDGGVRLVKYNDRGQMLGFATPGQTITVWLSGSGVTVTDPSGRVQASGGEPLAALPTDPTKPITIDEKLHFYRGILVFEN